MRGFGWSKPFACVAQAAQNNSVRVKAAAFGIPEACRPHIFALLEPGVQKTMLDAATSAAAPEAGPQVQAAALKALAQLAKSSALLQPEGGSASCNF